MRKTLVMFTIDSEAKLYAENGFWSYDVNGVLPRDLDDWLAHGVAKPGSVGYEIDQTDLAQRVRAFRGAAFDHFDPNLFDLRGTLDEAKCGLPQIFRSLDKFGFKSTAFVDFSGLYTFGAQDFGETMALIEGCGHDPQVHLHAWGPVGTEEWFAEMGLRPPKAPQIDDWDAETADRVVARVVADYRRLLGRDPVAYRGGGYRISDNLLAALSRHGFALDFSLDHQEKSQERYRLAGHERFANHPFDIAGLLEIPVTAFRPPGGRGVDRMRVAKKNRAARHAILRDTIADAPPILVYIMHSVSLMKKYSRGAESDGGDGDGESSDRSMRIGEDEGLAKIFEDELDIIANAKHLEVVTSAQLAERAGDVAREARLSRYFYQDVLLNRLPPDPAQAACNVCETLVGMTGDACPNCGASGRIRSFKLLYDGVLSPDAPTRPAGAALLVSPQGLERDCLARHFERMSEGLSLAAGQAGAFAFLFVPEVSDVTATAAAAMLLLSSNGVLCFSATPAAADDRDAIKACLFSSGWSMDDFTFVDPLTRTPSVWWLCGRPA